MQRSLCGKAGTLIYNRRRTICFIAPESVGKKWLRKELWGFFMAEVKGQDIKIICRVADEDWKEQGHGLLFFEKNKLKKWYIMEWRE